MSLKGLSGVVWTGLALLPAIVIAQTQTMTLPLGTRVPLVTVSTLSSKVVVKGDMVALQVAEDVTIGGSIAVPRGTPVVGQVLDARKKGTMGMSGPLLIRPLHLRVGERTVRLAGASSDKGTVTAGAVIGTIAVGVPFFTGRSAEIPAGTRLDAVVERTVELPRGASVQPEEAPRHPPLRLRQSAAHTRIPPS